MDKETGMKTNTQVYDEAVELLNNFADFAQTNREVNQGITSRQDIAYALARLMDNSGIVRADSKLVNLCASCFMFGVYIVSKSQGITMTEQEQATKCLRCQFIDAKNGTFKCRLTRCKYE